MELNTNHTRCSSSIGDIKIILRRKELKDVPLTRALDELATCKCIYIDTDDKATGMKEAVQDFIKNPDNWYQLTTVVNE